LFRARLSKMKVLKFCEVSPHRGMACSFQSYMVRCCILQKYKVLDSIYIQKFLNIKATSIYNIHALQDGGLFSRPSGLGFGTRIKLQRYPIPVVKLFTKEVRFLGLDSLTLVVPLALLAAYMDFSCCVHSLLHALLNNSQP